MLTAAALAVPVSAEVVELLDDLADAAAGVRRRELVLGDPVSELAFLSAFDAASQVRAAVADGVELTREQTTQLRRAEQAAGDLVEAVCSQVPSSAQKLIRRSMRRVRLDGDEDFRAALATQVVALLHDYDHDPDYTLVDWVTRRIRRSYRKHTIETYNVSWSDADNTVVAYTLAIEKQERADRCAAGLDPTVEIGNREMYVRVEEALIARRLETLERQGHDPTSSASRTLAKKYLTKKGYYQSLACLPQLRRAVQWSVSLDSERPEGGHVKDTVASHAGPVGGSYQPYMELLTDGELAALEAQNGPDACPEALDEAARDLAGRARAVLTAPHAHWARLTSDVDAMFVDPAEAMFELGVAGIAERLSGLAS